MKNTVLATAIGISALIGFAHFPTHPWRSPDGMHGREFPSAHLPGSPLETTAHFMGHADPMTGISVTASGAHRHPMNNYNETSHIAAERFITNEWLGTTPDEASSGSMIRVSNSGAGQSDDEINNEFAEQEATKISFSYADLTTSADADLNENFYGDNATVEMNLSSLALESDASMNENFSAENKSLSLSFSLAQADEEINHQFYSENK